MSITKIKNGETALQLASSNGHVGVVCELLKHDKVKVNHQNKNGYTALQLTSRNGHREIVCELLKHEKVDVNLEDTDGKNSAVYGKLAWPCCCCLRVVKAQQS